MPNYFDCPNIQDFLSVINPAQAQNFFNENYSEDRISGLDQGAYIVEIEAQGVWYDFSPFLANETMKTEDVYGFEIGEGYFELWDFLDVFSWRFMPLKGMKIRIKNYNDANTEYIGRIKGLSFKARNRRADGTERRRVGISMVDLKIDFLRFVFSETYPDGTTTYAVMKDAIENHTPFSATNIDAAKGFQLEGYKVNKRYAGDVIQEMLDLEVTSTIWVDQENLEVYVEEKHLGDAVVFEINRDNYDQVLNIREFDVSPEERILRNRVHFWFNGFYNTGTVAVTNGGTTIIGTGTKFLTSIKKGGKVTLEGDTTEYTIVDVFNNTDFAVSPAVVRGTDTGLTYAASGFRDYIVLDDGENIGTMAAILNESFQDAGVWEVVLPEKPNPLTREQARQVVRAYLNRLVSNLILKGFLKTENYKLNASNFRAGQVIYINLPVIRGIQVYAVMQKITRQHKKGILDRVSDGSKSWYDGVNVDAIQQLTIDFTDRRLYSEKVLEKVLQRQTEVQIIESEVVEAIKAAREYVYLDDCAGVVYGIGPNDGPAGDGAEEITLSDTASYSEVNPSGSYYTAPVSGGQNEAYCLASGKIAFVS